MTESRMNTVAVPALGIVTTQLGVPAVCKAALVPLRALIRNIGPVGVFLAYSGSELQGSTFAGVFLLPAGASESFLLVPQQGIYAVSQGAGGRVCYATSEAIPLG